MTLSIQSLRRLLLLTLLAALALVKGQGVMAQEDDTYKFDLGAGAGMSGYLGDANESNLFKHPGLAANISFRYLANPRLAVRGLLNLASLSGNTADWTNQLPGGAQYSFKSWVYDLQGRAEFNFFPFGIGETYKRLRRWTPYLALGVGCALSSSGGSTAVAFSVPMAAGVKFKVTKRFNLALEFAMTKVFGDHVDGPDLSDLYTIKSSFFKNTDWYSTLALSFSYEFGPRCVVCHRID